jgi:predicted HAD superfamily Cof-like phosphohydrolase
MGPEPAVEFRQTLEEPTIDRPGQACVTRWSRRDAFEMDERIDFVPSTERAEDGFEREVQLAARSS